MGAKGTRVQFPSTIECCCPKEPIRMKREQREDARLLRHQIERREERKMYTCIDTDIGKSRERGTRRTHD